MSELPDSTSGPTTRLAPSPTGALHLGNARTFLINWALARQKGWRIVLRVEDLDTPRIKAGAAEQAIEDLRWLGMDWDAGPLYQKHDLSPYTNALNELNRRGLIYPCNCTRREIESAQSAPHEDEHELRYPGTCRPSPVSSVQCLVSSVEEKKEGAAQRTLASDAGHWTLDTGRFPSAWRLQVPDEPVAFVDEFAGPQIVDVQAQVGDFVVATKAGLPAYQLAVVVDDARQRVTDVVRGDDLLRSTGRQIWLYRMLDLPGPPRYWHLPLVLGADGRRLAKRHGDTRLASYREQGVRPERVIGLLARWCGLRGGTPGTPEAPGTPLSMSSQDFLARFDIERLPHTPVTFSK